MVKKADLGSIPTGAKVTDNQVSSDAADKLANSAVAPKTTIQDFLDTMQRKEREQIVAKSKDYEVISDVDNKQLMLLQAEKRLYGYDPSTKTALVLKKEFIARKEQALKNK